MAEHLASEIEEDIRQRLEPSGLLPLGWFTESEKPALLIGNVGSSLWPVFSQSAQLLDGQPDPLNRWTTSTIDALEKELGGGLIGEIRYPFGTPNWPFQDYARRALGMGQSPIGLLIHREFGLWTAFRAVLLFRGDMQIPDATAQTLPCDSCEGKPCLSTCPISAFTASGYDYRACKSYIAKPEGRDCLLGGCKARQSCPVGQDHTYLPAHQTFHMKAYL